MYVKTADGLGFYNCDGFFIEDEDITYEVKGCLKNGGTSKLATFTSLSKAKEALNYLSNALLSKETVVTSPISIINEEDNIIRFKA